MKKETQPAPTEKLTVTLDGDLARRLKASATIERRKVEGIVAQAVQEYFERKRLKL